MVGVGAECADHTNFFENRVTEYEVAGLTGTWDDAYEDAA